MSMKVCDHCGREREIMAGMSTSIGGRVRVRYNLCHPNGADHPVYEKNGNNPDCYRLVTIYNEPIGSRKP